MLKFSNVGLAAIVYSIAMLVVGAIVIFHEGDNTALIVQIFGLATIAGIAILGYKQAIDTGAKVDDNTATTESTNKMVDGQMTDFKAALQDLAAQQAEVAAQKAEVAALVAEARGIRDGRAQVITEVAAATPAEPPV